MDTNLEPFRSARTGIFILVNNKKSEVTDEWVAFAKFGDGKIIWTNFKKARLLTLGQASNLNTLFPDTDIFEVLVTQQQSDRIKRASDIDWSQAAVSRVFQISGMPIDDQDRTCSQLALGETIFD